MPFPTSQLTLLVELALNADLTAAPGTWSWTDVTAYVYTRDPVRITRGRPDETSIAQPQKLTLTVNNRDGRWSTRNPSGAWYGQLRKGTPIRVSAEGHVRYAGFISSLPPRWDVSGNDRYAPLEAQGLLYRLAQGNSPARSPLRRTLAAAGPAAYWPFEDAASATQVVSGISGIALTTLRGGFAPGVQGGCVGSEPYATYTSPVAQFDFAGFAGTIDLTRYNLGSTKVSVSYIFTAGLAATPHPTNFETILIATSTGVNLALPTYAGYTGGARTATFGIDMFPGAVGGSTIGSGFDPFDGLTHSVLATWQQVGADIQETLVVDGKQMFSVTKAATTMGTPQTLNIGLSPGGTLDSVADDNTGATLSIGHLAVWGNVSATDPHQAAIGYAGELAGQRFLRLCAEEGIQPATLLDTA